MTVDIDEKKEPAKLSDDDIIRLWAWAHNTSGYWRRCLNEHQYDCIGRGAVVIISEADAINLSQIEKLSFDIGRFREMEKRTAEEKAESDTKEPRKGLQSIFRRTKRG